MRIKMEKLLLLAVICLLHGLAVGDDIVGDITLTTTGQATSSHWYHSTGIFVAGPNHLMFEAKASRDALVGLCASDSDETLQWEIIIGGENNQRDTLRSLTGTCERKTENSCYNASLNPNWYQKFWISWDETSIKLGTGDAVGKNEYCSHDGSFKLTDLYVRLGSWGDLNTVDWIVRGHRPQTSTLDGRVECDGSSCHPDAYCKRTQEGNRVCQCHPRYTGDGQNCEAVSLRGITPDQQSIIKLGFDAASAFTDVIEINDFDFIKFSKGLKIVATTASTFAPAVGLVFDLFLSALVEDAFTQEMKESFREVNRKLDQIQDSIEDLSDKVDWNEYKTELQKHMNIIESFAENIDELARLSPNDPGFASKKADVITEYNNNVGFGGRFKNFLIADDLGENLFEAFAKFVDYDCRRVHILMKLTLQSLIKASEAEMASIPLRIDSHEARKGRIEIDRNLWCGYFEAVQNKLVEVDDMVRNSWDNPATCTSVRNGNDIPVFAPKVLLTCLVLVLISVPILLFGL